MTIIVQSRKEQRLHGMHIIIDQKETLSKLVTRIMVQYLDAAKQFHEFVTDNFNGMSIVLFFQLIFTIILLFISIKYIIDITLTNKLVNYNSTTFTNMAVTKINDILNVNHVRILSYGKILSISISVMIRFFILDTNVIIEKPTNMKETIQQEEIQLKTEEHFQNFQNNHGHDIIDTVNYNVNIIDTLKQLNLIILFYVFRYDSLKIGVEKANEFEFKFQNKNVDCGDFVDGTMAFDTFDNGFVFGALSPTTPRSRVASRKAPFVFHTTHIQLPESNVLKYISK